MSCVSSDFLKSRCWLARRSLSQLGRQQTECKALQGHAMRYNHRKPVSHSSGSPSNLTSLRPKPPSHSSSPHPWGFGLGDAFTSHSVSDLRGPTGLFEGTITPTKTRFGDPCAFAEAEFKVLDLLELGVALVLLLDGPAFLLAVLTVEAGALVVVVTLEVEVEGAVAESLSSSSSESESMIAGRAR